MRTDVVGGSLAWMILCVLSLTACQLPGPTTPTMPVTMSDEDFNEYWRQLERRWPAYFEGQCFEVPRLPNRNDIRAWVRFEEVPAAYLSTCTASRSGLIRIGDDKWQSGCVPHELGHASCFYLGDRDGKAPLGCADFEHVKPKEGCQ